jgi:hypothetical protein
MEHLIQLYFEQEINEEELQQLKEHIEICPACRADFYEMACLFQDLDSLAMEERHRFQKLLWPLKWAVICVTMVLCVAISFRASQQQSSVRFLVQTEKQMQLESIAVTSGEMACFGRYPYMDTARMKPCQIIEAVLLHDPRLQPERLILVKAPDQRTLEAVLQLMGISMDPREIDQKGVDFPASYLIRAGDKPDIQLIYHTRE